ncbi:MAG: hypothetical protein ACFFDK_19515 [Promethearchaeota archaeon]
MSSEILHLLLLHFNSWTGPEIVSSFPEIIPEKISNKVRSIFDLDIEEHFFEITIRKENIKITNLFLEIPSEWGRGNVEMVMLSVITDEAYNTRAFQDILMEYATRIKGNPKIYKGFYHNSDIDVDHNETEVQKAELKHILMECFEDLKTRTISPDLKGGEIVKKFKKLSW